MKKDTGKKSAGIGTSVCDLLTLLALAFLSIGALAPVIGPAGETLEALEERAREMDGTLEASFPGVDALAEEKGRLLDVLGETMGLEAGFEEVAAAAQVFLANLLLKLHSETGALRALEKRLEALQAKEQSLKSRESELSEVKEDLAGRDEDIDRARKELDSQQQKLADLEAQLAGASREKRRISGTPIVDSEKSSKQPLDLVLSKGNVLPVEKPYYKFNNQFSGIVIAEPDAAGMRIADAVSSDSTFYKRITGSDFRARKRLRIFVNADSFSTYRVLRDLLVKEDIDYGWLPHDDARVFYVASGGADTDNVRRS